MPPAPKSCAGAAGRACRESRYRRVGLSAARRAVRACCRQAPPSRGRAARSARLLVPMASRIRESTSQVRPRAWCWSRRLARRMARSARAHRLRLAWVGEARREMDLGERAGVAHDRAERLGVGTLADEVGDGLGRGRQGGVAVRAAPGQEDAHVGADGAFGVGCMRPRRQPDIGGELRRGRIGSPLGSPSRAINPVSRMPPVSSSL